MEEYATPFTSEDTPAIDKASPLLDYASKSLVYHIGKSEPRPEQLADEILRFAASKNCLNWAENYSIHLILGNMHTEIQDFETCAVWLRRSWDGQRFLKEFQKTVESGLADRSTQFGQNSWRNDHLKLAIPIIAQGLDSDGAIAAETQPALPSFSQSRIQEMTRMVMWDSSFPISSQLNLLFGLSYYLPKIEFLTDPLELLFRSILSKAAIIPSPVLLAIGHFYQRINKQEKAMEVLCAVLPKAGLDSYWGRLVRLEIGQMKLVQDQWVEAELWYRDLLTNWIRDGDHLVNTVRHSLGVSLYSQEKYAEAEKMYQRALQDEEKALGPDHISTLCTVYYLGHLYADLKRYNEAENMYQRALQGYEKARGPNFIWTPYTIFFLGRLYAELKRYDRAENMFQRAVQGYKKVRGPHYISTFHAVYCLGRLYADAERCDEAENMYQ